MHKYGIIANRKMEMAKSLHLPQCIISSNSYLHACLKIIVFPIFVATHLHQHILYLLFHFGGARIRHQTNTNILVNLQRKMCFQKARTTSSTTSDATKYASTSVSMATAAFLAFLLQMMATDALMFCSWAFCSCHAVLQFCDAGP